MPRPLRVAVILVAAALLGAKAHAQAYSVPPALQGVISQSNIDDAGRAAIKNYVTPLARDLGGADPGAAGLAREDLIAPLAAGENISVGFRLTYAESLLPTIERLARGADDVRAVAALRIAGHLGTGQSVALLTDAIASPAPAVRYAAAQGLGETLRLVAESNPALQAGAADQIIQRLAGALAGEGDAHVADAMVRALDAPRASEPLRRAAAVAMTSGMIDQIRARRAALAAGASTADASASMIRAIVSARSLFIDLGAGAGRDDLNVAVGAALMAGQAMSWGAAAIRAAGGFEALSGAEFEAVNATLRAAEALAALAHVSAVRGQNIVEQPVSQALDRRDLQALDAAVTGWVGPGGRLTRPPYNGKPEDFR